MPIYECYCEACRITFEILAPVIEANRKRACPRCARASRRVVSAFAIGNAGTRGDTPAADSPAHSPARAGAAPAGHMHNGHSHQRRPGRPTVPDFARLCWMDDRSAERFAAYKLGRGAEYDDKSAAHEDLRKKRGLPAVAPADQSYSPVAQMVARKKAEQAKKAPKTPKPGASNTAPR